MDDSDLLEVMDTGTPLSTQVSLYPDPDPGPDPDPDPDPDPGPLGAVPPGRQGEQGVAPALGAPGAPGDPAGAPGEVVTWFWCSLHQALV